MASGLVIVLVGGGGRRRHCLYRREVRGCFGGAYDRGRRVGIVRVTHYALRVVTLGWIRYELVRKYSW